jgi:hypothetical protein
MLAARLGVEGTVDQLHQAVNQEIGAFTAEAGFMQIEPLKNPPPDDILLCLIAVMIGAVYLHHPGQHGSVVFYLLRGDTNHGWRISQRGALGIDFGQ